MSSIEEKVEEHFKALLDDLHIRHFGKTEKINSSIIKALKTADSKSGGSGANYPDIQLLLQNKTRRDIPVMIEAKGTKNKLEKLTSGGDIELVSGGKNPNRAVQQFAVNGALHYGLAILDEGTYSEVIIIGINETTLEGGHVNAGREQSIRKIEMAAHIGLPFLLYFVFFVTLNASSLNILQLPFPAQYCRRLFSQVTMGSSHIRASHRIGRSYRQMQNARLHHAIPPLRKTASSM